MSAITAHGNIRTATSLSSGSRSITKTIAAPIELPKVLENTTQRSRRLALASERRHHRTTSIVSTVLISIGGAGTLAFAAMMVSFH